MYWCSVGCFLVLHSGRTTCIVDRHASMFGKYRGLSVGFVGLEVGVGFGALGIQDGLDWFFGFGIECICDGRESFILIFSCPSVLVGAFASLFEETNLLNVAGFPLSNAFSSSVAHFLCVSVRAWLLAISVSSSLGERGARSRII